MTKKNSVQEGDEEPTDDSREPTEESDEEADAMYSLTEQQQETLDQTDDLIGGKSGLCRQIPITSLFEVRYSYCVQCCVQIASRLRFN